MYKPYALITGASEGLGKYISLECARRQMNLVLVALPNSNFTRLAKYLEKKYKIDVLCFELDLSDINSCHQLYKEVKEKDIIINTLINNAGMGGTFFFDEKNADYYAKLLSLNVTTPTLLCRLFLNDLKRSSPSYILNVSSLAGLFSLPKKQVYGATKSYLLSFSKSLRQELKNENVSVSVLCPGIMNTNWRLLLANRTTGTWIMRQSVMEPMKVAGIAIKSMLNKKEVTIPGFWNHFFIFLSWIIPGKIRKMMINFQIKSVLKSEAAVVRVLKQRQQLATAR